MTPKFDDAYRYRTGRPRAEDAHIWKQIEAYVKARIEEGYTRDQIRDELRQRIKEKLGRDDLPINYTYINKIQRKYNLKLTKRNKWQKPGYTDASVDHRYKPKTEGVDRVNVIKSRTDELAKSFISKGMKPEEAIKIAAIQAEKEYYKKLDDLKKDQQGHIAIQNVKNTKFPPRYKKIDGKKYKL